jgi:hypothetical protein
MSMGLINTDINSNQAHPMKNYDSRKTPLKLLTTDEPTYSEQYFFSYASDENENVDSFLLKYEIEAHPEDTANGQP